MSRDWTPCETYLAQMQLGFSTVDMMKGLVVVKDNEEKPAYLKEDIEICEKYPYLGNLLDNFANVYRDIISYSSGVNVLDEIENELKIYIEEDTGDEDSLAIQWFHGKLDKNFHYREFNDEKFICGMKKLAKEKTKQNV